MKTTQKITVRISILLLVSLLMNMLPVSFINFTAEQLTAFAEERAARNAAQPASDVMISASGWIYRICVDGYAEVLGYTDSSATDLTIPYSLGGAWVVRVGENAFCENIDLVSIFVPGTITEIADSAFSVQSDLNVCAYNGAGALEFAKKKGFSSDNLSEYDFFDEIIDLTELKSSQWSFQGSAALTIADPWARRVEEGSRLYIPPCRKYENGLPAQATSVTANGSSITVTYIDLDFMESVETYHAEDVELHLDAANTVILADGFEIADSAATYGVGANQSYTTSFPLKFTADYTFKNGLKLNGDITISNDFTVTLDYGFFKINEVQISKKSWHGFNINLSYSEKIHGEGFLTQKGQSASTIEFARVPITQLGPISGYVSLALNVSVEGEVSLTGTFSTTETYIYKNGELTTKKSKNSPDFNVSAGVKVSALVNGSLGIGLGFGGQSIDFFKATISVGPELEREKEVTLYKSETDETGTIREIGTVCHSLSLSIILQITAKVGLIINDEDKDGGFGSYVTATLFNTKWTLLRLYWDVTGMKWIKTLDGYQLVGPDGTLVKNNKVSFYTGTDQKIADQYAALGDKITEPEKIRKDGYTFKGWAIGDSIWDFENDTVSGNMTLYAVWVEGATIEETDLPVPRDVSESVENANWSSKHTTVQSVYNFAELDSALIGKVLYVQDRVGGGFKMTAPTDGDYYFSVLAPYLPKGYMSIVSNFDYARNWKLDYVESDAIQTKVVKGVKKGEILYWWNCGDLEIWNTLTQPFRMMINVNNDNYNNDYYYQIDNDACTITSYVGNEKNVVIPDKLGGCTVTAIGDSVFAGNKSLTSVSIPARVTSIGNSAFSGCSRLRDITIPSGVTSIGYAAFSECSSLTEITIPRKVKSIGDSAFRGCSNLARITMPDSLTSIGASAFSNCGNLKKITIPNSVQSIGTSAFAYCTNLTKIAIPDGVTSINAFTFECCSNLIEVKIPDSITSIGAHAFSACENLKEIVIPDGVTSLDWFAFGECGSLTSITIPDGLTSIPDAAFTFCVGLTDVIIPDGVVSIGAHAFEGCEGLVSVTVPESVAQIADDAFNACFSLESLYTTPGSVAERYFKSKMPQVEILDSAGRTGILTFNSNGGTIMPQQYVNVGSLIQKPENPVRDQYVFTGWYTDAKCTNAWNFASGKMPASQLTLYAGWSYLPSSFVYDIVSGSAVITDYVGEDVYLSVPSHIGGKSVTALAAECIGGGVRQIILPDTVNSIDPQAFRWAFDLHTITVAEGNSNFYSKDGVLYSTDGTLVCYPRAKTADSFMPASGTKAIGDYAFYAADGLNALILPDGLTTIGNCAIYDCDGIRSLSIPASVKWFGDYAVYDCGALERIDFDSDPISIGSGNFVGSADDLVMFGPIKAESLGGHADVYLLSYNEYIITYMMYGKKLACINARAGDLLGVPPGPEDGEMSFKGWSLQENGELWDFEKDIMPEEDITLYAIWKYDFSYETVDGGVKLLRYNGNKTEIRIPASIEGRTVVEIAKDCFGEKEGITLIADKGSVAEMYASENGFAFNALSYTLTFCSNGGTYVAPRTLCATDNIIEPTVRRSNYTFNGWYSDVDCTKIFNFSYGMPASDLTLYADWEKVDSTVEDVPFDFVVNETGLTITGYTGTKTSVIIPEQINDVAVTAIGAHAFEGNETMFTVTVPGSVAEIEEAAFASSRVRVVTLENGITEIGAHAFDGCYELQNIVIPDTVTSIREYAFQDCISLLEIELPFGLNAIPDGMLSGCSFIESLTLPAALESIGENAFNGCVGITAIELGENVSEVQISAFNGCSALTTVDVTDENMYYMSINGVLMNADGTTLIFYPHGKNDDFYVIPSGVTAIGEAAMTGCAIESLVLNDELFYIGKDALRGCWYLSEIIFSADGALNGIGESAFQHCDSLRTLELPGSLEYIEANAFDGCGLLSVTFVGDVMLGSDAFSADDGLTFYGSRGWEAEEYANAYSIRFVDPAIDIPVTGIVVDSECVLEMGTEMQLSAVLTPENTTETKIVWSSSDASVVAVSFDGTISARYEGVATITATAQNGSLTVCTVTVIKPQPKQIKLSTDTAETILGNDIMLTATLSEEAEADVVWHSSNPKIAVVENGTVRALRTGVVYITAAADGYESAVCGIEIAVPEKLTDGLKLPQSLTYLDEEAFAGGTFESVIIPEGMVSIGVRAFADYGNLQQVTIPDSVSEIASDAFDACGSLVIFCTADSMADQYALSYEIPCVIEE